MADIRITGISPSAVQPPQAQPAAPAPDDSSAVKDELRLTGSQGADLNKAFWEKAKQLGDAREVASMAPASPVIFGNSAGWKARLLSPGGTNCYAKVPLDDGASVLVVPLQNHGGGGFGRPVVASGEKGITDLPDVKPFGSSQALGLSRSAGGERIYLYSHTEPLIKVYDRALKEEAAVDLGALDPEYGKVRDFTSTPSADYVYVAPKDFHSDKGWLVALDPATHAPKWTKTFDTTFSEGIFVSPAGVAFVPVEEDGDKPDKHVVHAFAPDGRELGTLRMTERVQDITFLRDGTIVANQGRKGVRALAPAKVGTLVKEKWAIPEKNYKDFQSSADGHALYAVDPCDGFYRSHVLVKIDPATGKVDWERKAFGESCVDMRVVGDDLCLVTASEDHKTVHLRKLDSSGKVTWEDHLAVGEIDEYTEGMQECITPRGDFVFGGRQDGNLYFVHPKKPGETEQSVRQGLDRPAEILEDLMKAADERVEKQPPAEIAQSGDFLVVDGVKLQKRKD